MGIWEISIIVAVVLGCIVAIYKAVGTKKKSKKKDEKKDKTQPQKKEELAQPDRSFKIEKKERLTKVSRNAVNTNSRTAQIEKVFAREPETDKSILIDDVNHQEEVDAEPIQVKPDKKNMSNGGAGYFVGDYSGIHLGRKPYSPANNSGDVGDDPNTKRDDNASNENADIIDNFTTVENLIKQMRDNRANSRNPSIRRSSNSADERDPTAEASPSTDFDLNQMVEANAILNPKYVSFINKNKKTP